LIKRIFLDLDDVCNTFTPFALNYVGCPISPTDYGVYKPEWGFDIVKAANALHPHHRFTFRSFWESIHRLAWASVPESPGFRPLLNLCEQLVGRENICILTNPIDDPECLAGKLDWIHEHFPKWMHRQFLMGPPKHLCARSDALMIDDNDENVRAFRENGGYAILMPRPWNALHIRTYSPLYHEQKYILGALLDYFPYDIVKQAA
jgi:FMN phosphatase YigB (HAD superfamily)